MKIEILIDEKSKFPRDFLLTISGLQYVASSISAISVNTYHNVKCTKQGVYIDGYSLINELAAHHNTSAFERTLFLTKAALPPDLRKLEDVFTISFYELQGIENIAIQKLLEILNEPLGDLITDVEERYLASVQHPIAKIDPDLRFKLPLDPVVMPIHGMNTPARWEKELTTLLNSEDISTFSGEYDVFRGVFSDSARSKVRSIILSKYEEMLEKYPDTQYRHVVIAHSYGTYGLFDMFQRETISKYPDCIILAAPILSRKNRLWKDLVDHNVRIYLDIGKRDWVVRTAPLLRLFRANLAGLSGYYGVKGGTDVDLSSPISSEYIEKLKSINSKTPVNLIYPGKGHSDYFSRSHFKNRWLPLIRQDY